MRGKGSYIKPEVMRFKVFTEVNSFNKLKEMRSAGNLIDTVSLLISGQHLIIFSLQEKRSVFVGPSPTRCSATRLPEILASFYSK